MSRAAVQPPSGFEPYGRIERRGGSIDLFARVDPAALCRVARAHDMLSVFDGVCATAAEAFEYVRRLSPLVLERHTPAR